MTTGKKIPYIIITVLVIVIMGGGLMFFSGNKNGQQGTQTSATGEMVDCGKFEDPNCFFSRMSQCLPVTAELTGTDNSSIEITILGVEDEKCHFQRKIGGALNLDCRFPKGTMNWDTIDQTFGNDKGLQNVVDESCTMGGW